VYGAGQGGYALGTALLGGNVARITETSLELGLTFAGTRAGQAMFGPEPGAQLGAYRVRPQVAVTDPLVDPGRLLPVLPKGEAPNFASAEPVFIGGRPLYRVSDGVFGVAKGQSNANGGYWADRPAPNTEAAWRSNQAVLDEWPNRGSTEGVWTPQGGWAWGGAAAPQGITGSYREFNAFGSTYRYGWIQRGGGYQVWVPDSFNTIKASDIGLRPTPWWK
jgi:hypothetical protein